MSEFKKLIEKLNAELEEPYKFTLDKVISSAWYSTEIIGYADSVLNDWGNIPPHLKSKIVTSNISLSINKWINKRLWMDILNSLLKDEILFFKTRLVRLRIATNMSVSLAYNLTEIEREEWRQYIVNVFYKRCFAINNYYCKDILQLPFQHLRVIVIGLTITH